MRKLRPQEGNVNVFQLIVPTVVLADITVCLPSQPEGKIGLPRANPRGRLRSPS